MVIYAINAYSLVRFTIPLLHLILLHQTSSILTGVICPRRHLISFELLSFGLVKDEQKCESNDCDFWFRACIVGECGVNDGVLLHNGENQNNYVKGSKNDTFQLQYDNRKNYFILRIQLLDDDSKNSLSPREAWIAFDQYNRYGTYPAIKKNGSNTVSCVWEKTHLFPLASYSATFSNSTGTSEKCNEHVPREHLKQVNIHYNFVINITRMISTKNQTTVPTLTSTSFPSSVQIKPLSIGLIIALTISILINLLLVCYIYKVSRTKLSKSFNEDVTKTQTSVTMSPQHRRSDNGSENITTLPSYTCSVVKYPSARTKITNPSDESENTVDAGADSSTIRSIGPLFKKASDFCLKPTKYRPHRETSRVETVSTSVPSGSFEMMNPRAENTDDSSPMPIEEMPIEFLKRILRKQRRNLNLNKGKII